MPSDFYHRQFRPSFPEKRSLDFLGVFFSCPFLNFFSRLLVLRHDFSWALGIEFSFEKGLCE